jgi:hypothetical protein
MLKNPESKFQQDTMYITKMDFMKKAAKLIEERNKMKSVDA